MLYLLYIYVIYALIMYCFIFVLFVCMYFIFFSRIGFCNLIIIHYVKNLVDLFNDFTSYYVFEYYLRILDMKLLYTYLAQGLNVLHNPFRNLRKKGRISRLITFLKAALANWSSTNLAEWGWFVVSHCWTLEKTEFVIRILLSFGCFSKLFAIIALMLCVNAVVSLFWKKSY